MQVIALLAVLLTQTVFVRTDAAGRTTVLETMPDGIGEGESVWAWSPDCAPQRFTAASKTVPCLPGKRMRVRVAARPSRLAEGVEVRWGTEAMLSELPDALLPFVRTDAAGTATIVAPEGERVLARAAGPAVASLWQDASSSIAAMEAAPMQWRIADAEGHPAAGARMEIRSTGPWRIRAAGDGILTIPPVPADSFLRVLAWSDGGAPLTVVGRARDLTRSLRLERGLTLRGTVLGEDDKPLPRSTVSALFLPSGETVPLKKIVLSDDDGRFVFSGLPAASVEWSVEKASFGRSTHLDQLRADHDAGIIRLYAARPLTVHVRDARGEPVADATLIASDGGEAGTDARGQAILRQVPASAFTLTARAHGFRTRDVRVRENVKQPLVIELADASRVRAQLVRGDGTPAGPGDVAVRAGRRSFIAGFGSDGRLDVDLGQGGSVSLEIRAEGLAPFRVSDREVAEGELVDLGTIELGSGFAITGRAIDAESGAPLEGAAVHVLRPNEFGPLLAYARRDSVTAAAMADGAFRVDGLAPGVYSLWTEAVGHAAVVKTGLSVASDLPNGELVLGDLEIPAGKTVAVSCTPAARCGEEAAVTTADADWLSIAAPLRDGHGTIAPVPAGSALLRLSERGATLHERTIAISADRPVTEVEVRMPSVTVHGRVTRGGRAVSGGAVSFEPWLSRDTRFVQVAHVRGTGTLGSTMVGAPARVTTVNVADDGTFLLQDCAPGDYRVSWTAGGAPSAAQRVVVPEATEVPLQIDLPAGRVEGRVLSEEAGSPPRTLVSVEGAGVSTQVIANGDGTFAFEGLPAGSMLVRARTTDRREAEARLELRDHGTQHVELTLRGTNREALRVTVRGAGIGVPNAYVFARQRGAMHSAMTAADGTARLSAIAAAEPVDLAVFAPQYGWTFVAPASRVPELAIDVVPATAALTLQGDWGGAPAMLFAPSGFPIHDALSLLGFRVASPLRVDRLPAGTYTAICGGAQQQIVLGREPRSVRF